MHSPLRTEADVFRLVVAIGVAAVSVIALVALVDPTIGIVWGAALIGFGIGFGLSRARGSMRPGPPTRHGADGRYRLLVVANQTVAGRALLEEIRNRCRGRDSEVLVIAPALVSSRAAQWASDVDEGIAQARERLQASLAAIAAAGLDARGEIGDSDPELAIEDALRKFAATEILISTHPAAKSRWLEQGVVERARRELRLPVTHVVVDLEAEVSPTPPPAA